MNTNIIVILQNIIDKLNELDSRINLIEMAIRDDDIFAAVADIYNEDNEEIMQHNEIL